MPKFYQQHLAVVLYHCSKRSINASNVYARLIRQSEIQAQNHKLYKASSVAFISYS